MPEATNTPNTSYLDSLQNWIDKYDSPIDDLDLSISGYVADQFNRPAIIPNLSSKEEADQTKQNEKGRIKPFWTWFLVAVAILAIIAGLSYLKKRAKK